MYAVNCFKASNSALVQERRFAPAMNQSRAREPLQVVTQRRGRQIDVRLNFARGGTLRAARDNEAKDGEPRRMPERAQLLGM